MSGSSPSFVAIVASPPSISTAISDGFISQCFQGSQHHAQSSP
jgi:hypothetical protein